MKIKNKNHKLLDQDFNLQIVNFKFLLILNVSQRFDSPLLTVVIDDCLLLFAC